MDVDTISTCVVPIVFVTLPVGVILFTLSRRAAKKDRVRAAAVKPLQIQPEDRHAEFNKLVRIRANAEAEAQVQQILGAPEVQAVVRKLLQEVPDAFLDDTGAGVDVASMVSDEQEFRRYFSALSATVRVIDGMR